MPLYQIRTKQEYRIITVGTLAEAITRMNAFGSTFGPLHVVRVSR